MEQGLPKLTRKQKAFVDAIMADPKQSLVKAALQTYGKPDKPVTYNSARQIAVDNLQKPSIQAYMGIHAEKASRKIVNLIDSEREEISLNASKDVLDRFYGKAVQKTEINSTGVVLTLDLTSSLEG